MQAEDEQERRRKWGPRVTAALCASTRDEPGYRNPGDHGPDGLFVGGPIGEQCVLAMLIGFIFCTDHGSMPDAARQQSVTYRGRKLQRQAIAWRDDDGADPDDPNAALYAAVLRVMAGESRPMGASNGGGYARPKKPLSSGRKRKVA